MGLSVEDVRTAIANTNSQGPLGIFDGDGRAVTIGTNDQLRLAPQYDSLVMRSANGTVVKLSAIATIQPGVRNSRSFGWYNRQPSVLLVLNKALDANVIETADRIRAIIPDIKRFIPTDIDVTVISDRTQTIRASVTDMQLTLLAAIMLVMLVVFLFLRRTATTIAAGVTVPLALAGTCAMMWCVGFSIDNLSLMALACSVGFVVDDAIVMIENCFRNLEKGMTPIKAALEGARQIGFTVVAISVSLIAAFVPLLFMSGVVGRVFREFSLTLAFAIAVSTVVSLTLTPMICAHFVRRPPSKSATRLDRAMEYVMGWLVQHYERSLMVVLRHRALTLAVLAGVLALTCVLYIKASKSYFPQDDTGLIYGGTVASTDTSFETMYELQQKAAEIVMADPAVAGVGSSIRTSSYNASSNRGQLFINLKPLSERKISSWDVINRLRPQLERVPGLNTFFWVPQDIQRAGGPPTRPISIRSGVPTIRRWRSGRRMSTTSCARCRNWSTSPPTATVAGFKSMCSPTGSPPPGLACASRTSTSRSTTPSASARFPRCTASATNTASFLKPTRNSSATRATSPASTFRAPTAYRFRLRP